MSKNSKIKPEEILSDENYDYLRHETDETLGDVLSVVLWDMKTYYPPETVQTWREILLSRPDAEKHYIQNAIDVCEDYIRFEQGNSLSNGTQKDTQKSTQF